MLRWTGCCAGQSRCSKAASVEMEDLSEQLAIQYLEKRGVAAKAASQVVDVTGGRLLQLMCAVEVLQAGGTSEGVQICCCAAVPPAEHRRPVHSRLSTSPQQQFIMLQPA